jgi:DNA-binding MarR family transcriptional regulator
VSADNEQDPTAPGATGSGAAAPDPTAPDPIAQWTAAARAVEVAQQRVLGAVMDAELPAQWFAVSQLLLAAPGQRLPMSKIARDVSMTTGGFTKLADRLAREGLIDRRGAAGDRRVVYATLTERGLHMARAGAKAYAAAIREQILGTIPASELATLAEITGHLGRGGAPVEADDDPTDGDFEVKERPPASPERRGRGTGTSARPG